VGKEKEVEIDRYCDERFVSFDEAFEKKVTGLADVGDSFRSQSRGSILRASCSGLVQ
jgi:hypothetical protein